MSSLFFFVHKPLSSCLLPPLRLSCLFHTASQNFLPSFVLLSLNPPSCLLAHSANAMILSIHFHSLIPLGFNAPFLPPFVLLSFLRELFLAGGPLDFSPFPSASPFFFLYPFFSFFFLPPFLSSFLPLAFARPPALFLLRVPFPGPFSGPSYIFVKSDASTQSFRFLFG